MRHFKSAIYVLVMLAIALPLGAQNKVATSSGNTKGMSSGNSAGISNKSSAGISNSNNGGSSNSGAGAGSNGTSAATGHEEPCWKVAGIAPSAMQQRRSIEQNARSQVAAVCADSSLSAQQRHQKIQQIHQQAHQQAEGLITLQQQEALKACQSSRGGRTVAPNAGGSGKGPCGETQEPSSGPSTGNHKPN